MSFITPSPAYIGNNSANSIFTTYLIDELIASGLYDRSLSNKSPEEKENFKTNLIEIWFKALSGAAPMTQGGLTFAITRLSAKRNWADSQIIELCSILNYDAKKEMQDNPHSWTVLYKN